MPISSKHESITIVIPVFNEAEYLYDCLESIRHQVVPPDEVIVVDNNSTDDSVRIARQFPFVTVVQARRQGIAYARNVGFNAASSTIIGRIDADTQLSPTWVMDVLDGFAAEATVAAMTGRCYFYDVAFTRFSTGLHEAVYYTLQSQLAGGAILWGSNMAIRKSVWLSVRGYCSSDTDIPEDIDLSLVLHAAGYEISKNVSLEAAVSLRRGNLSPQAVEAYLRWWPRVYRHHDRHMTANAVWVLYVSVCLGAVLTWPFMAFIAQSPKLNASRPNELFD